MMGLIMSVLGMIAVVICVGLLIGLIIYVPTFIYCIPYDVWASWNAGSKGIPKMEEFAFAKKQKGGVWLHCKNATKLYRSWITKKPHGITDF